MHGAVKCYVSHLNYHKKKKKESATVSKADVAYKLYNYTIIRDIYIFDI